MGGWKVGAINVNRSFQKFGSAGEERGRALAGGGTLKEECFEWIWGPRERTNRKGELVRGEK